MTMVKQFLLIFGLLFSIQVMAQTGIGTTTPNASAKLDVYATNKGFLPPRVTLTSTTDAITITSPAEGLLVYNLGSVGLQAGYYYWNGANWATIATATSAGNGVTSMDMVKLYGEVHSKASGKIGNSTTGFVFSVPVSGRYLFDFTSGATALNGGTNTIFFTVRQGTTVLASDMQSSYNNNVHVEYNGKVEVNLQAGVSYNVYNYATSGSFETNDYDRVYYKLVAGNLPVTGQSVDYVQASLSANQTYTAVGNINFNTSSGAGITITSGGFNLKANKTYKLEAAIGGTSGGYAYYGWVDNSNNLLSGGSTGAVMKAGVAYSDAPQDKAVVYFTPTVDTRVFLRVYSLSGTLAAYAPSISVNYSSTWASIQQVGSSAIINPWTLSGTNTYNTTGNVGIGTSTPTSRLNIVGGGIKIHNGFTNNTARPSLTSTAIGSYEIRGVGSIEGSTQVDAGNDGFLRLSAGGGTNTTAQSSIDLSGFSSQADMNNNIVMRTAGSERMRIDASGNVNITGKLNVDDPSGNVVTKTSRLVNRGVDVTLGNLKARIAATGNISLQLSTVSGTYSVYGSSVYSQGGVIGTTIDGSAPRAISTTPAYLNSSYSFGTAGATDTWIIMDTSNSIAWRITMILGSGTNNNLISIERLL